MQDSSSSPPPPKYDGNGRDVPMRVDGVKCLGSTPVAGRTWFYPKGNFGAIAPLYMCEDCFHVLQSRRSSISRDSFDIKQDAPTQARACLFIRNAVLLGNYLISIFESDDKNNNFPPVSHVSDAVKAGLANIDLPSCTSYKVRVRQLFRDQSDHFGFNMWVGGTKVVMSDKAGNTDFVYRGATIVEGFKPGDAQSFWFISQTSKDKKEGKIVPGTNETNIIRFEFQAHKTKLKPKPVVEFSFPSAGYSYVGGNDTPIFSHPPQSIYSPLPPVDYFLGTPPGQIATHGAFESDHARELNRQRRLDRARMITEDQSSRSNRRKADRHREQDRDRDRDRDRERERSRSLERGSSREATQDPESIFAFGDAPIMRGGDGFSFGPKSTTTPSVEQVDDSIFSFASASGGPTWGFSEAEGRAAQASKPTPPPYISQEGSGAVRGGATLAGPGKVATLESDAAPELENVGGVDEFYVQLVTTQPEELSSKLNSLYNTKIVTAMNSVVLLKAEETILAEQLRTSILHWLGMVELAAGTPASVLVARAKVAIDYTATIRTSSATLLETQQKISLWETMLREGQEELQVLKTGKPKPVAEAPKSARDHLMKFDD